MNNYETSALRNLHSSAEGGLGKGKLGVVMASAGVGKTACLVQIGLESLLNEEDVIQKNPDYIITIDSSGMGDLDAAAVIKARESWQSINAVKDGNVLVVGNDAFTRPGPRLAEAVETLYELIYGEAEEVPAA